MRKVLVTGADGFIGKNLVKSLLQNNIHVYAIIYPDRSSLEEMIDERLHIYRIDLHQILDYTADFPIDIDVMYHFAWCGVRQELRDDFDIQIENVQIALDCMKFAIAIGIRKVIFPGSTSEYMYYGKPLDKDAVPSPNSAYGAVKVAVHYLCSNIAVRNHINFVYVVISGIYAADRRDNNVIFYTIDKLLHREKPSLTKLEQLWDYVYVEDVVDALIAVGHKGKDGAVYAIGHGDNWPLSKYIKIIHQKIDPLLPLGIGEIPYVNDKLPCSCVNLTDLEQDTGFVPKVDFETGITRVIDKMRSDMEEKSVR